MLVWVLLKDGKRKTNNQVEISEKEHTPSECDSIGNPSDQDTGRGQGLNGGKKKKKNKKTHEAPVQVFSSVWSLSCVRLFATPWTTSQSLSHWIIREVS